MELFKNAYLTADLDDSQKLSVQLDAFALVGKYVVAGSAGAKAVDFVKALIGAWEKQQEAKLAAPAAPAAV